MKPEHIQLLLLLFIAPLFVAMIFGEYFIAKRRNLTQEIYNKQDILANAGILGLRFLVNGIIIGGALAWIFDWVYNYHLPLATHLSPILYWAILIIGEDFCYYWFHR